MSKPKNEAGQYLSLLLKLGLQMCLSILFFMTIGLLLDKYLNLGKIILVPCILLGVAGGFYALFKEMNKLSDLDI
jgi:F0F1-type ATP synthase assembly protein I|tara:strand:- start:294 stop:518 length:225 start_codon:yes stop_codon:yes gene_type:complete